MPKDEDFILPEMRNMPVTPNFGAQWMLELYKRLGGNPHTTLAEARAALMVVCKQPREMEE